MPDATTPSPDEITTRAAAGEMGWRYDIHLLDFTKPDGTRTAAPPTPDDMLAFLKQRVSRITFDPIASHESGVTICCYDTTEPMQPNRLVCGISAPTLHDALEQAVIAVGRAE